jgi:hypothetical protein
MRAGASLQAGYWICDRETEAGFVTTLHHIELQSYLLVLKKTGGCHEKEGERSRDV